ncbi:putative helicase, partial [Hamiltosporidium magnivora]
FNNSTNEQHPLDNSTNEQHPLDNSTNEQHPLDNSTSNYHPLNNSTNEQHPINNSTNQQHPLNNNNKVGIITGDTKINVKANILILTTEVLRNMLYTNTLPINTQYVIFDEIHYISNKDRGVVWEECLLLLPKNITLLLLSATTPYPQLLGNWIGRIREETVYIVSTSKRVVPLIYYVYSGEDIIEISKGKYVGRGVDSVRGMLEGSYRGSNYKGDSDKSRLEGDSDKSRLEGDSDKSMLEGDSDKSRLEGDNTNSNTLHPVSNKSNKQHPVNISTNKQQGVNNSTIKQHLPNNNTSKQHPVNNSIHEQHPVSNNIYEQHPVSNNIYEQHPVSNNIYEQHPVTNTPNTYHSVNNNTNTSNSQHPLNNNTTTINTLLHNPSYPYPLNILSIAILNNLTPTLFFCFSKKRISKYTNTLYSFNINLLNNKEKEEVESIISKYIKGCKYSSSMRGVSYSSSMRGVNNSRDMLEGVNNSRDMLEGVNNKDIRLEGVNNSRDMLEGVNNKDSRLEGVNNVSYKQQGVSNSIDNDPLINSTDKQQGVSNSIDNDPLINSTDKQQGVSNSIDNNSIINTPYTIPLNNTLPSSDILTLPQFILFKSLALRGIATHHSSLIPFIKEITEILFNKSLLKIIICTETFSMGVNLPVKCVIFDSYYKQGKLLNNSEFVQMSGRAGRRGIDDKGVVIINGIRGVRDKGSNIKGVSDKGSNIKGVNHKVCNIKGIEDKGSNIKGVSDKGSNIKGVNHK